MLEVEAVTPPQGVFRGSNFMTPDVIGYFRVSPYRRYSAVYVEFAKGRGFHGESIYGVSVRRANGEMIRDPDPSKLFHSMRAATEYIQNGLKDEDEE